MRVQNSRGRHVELGEMINKGGEAEIRLVKGQPALVAKIYHAHRAQREAKLKAMLEKVPVQPATHTALAWPIELLYAQGKFVGFLMPKIDGYDRIFNFYNPALRKKRHPSFNWRYLHRTASNLAIVVETVHQAGHLVGDLNESNVLLNDRALVTLVDTDSFQIKGPNTSIYHCLVGKAEYTPAELQGVSLSSVNRQREHDCFGLAVLIFQLLMQGYHPFSGVLSTALSVGRVDVYGIKEGIFPYHQNGTSSRIQTPPNAPSFALLHPDLQALFIRCFVNGHQRPTERPTAREWQVFLQKAEQALVMCTRETTHIYSNHLGDCPFCPSDQVKQEPLPVAGQMLQHSARRANALNQSPKRKIAPWEGFFQVVALAIVGFFITMLLSFGFTSFTRVVEVTVNRIPSEATEVTNTPYTVPSKQVPSSDGAVSELINQIDSVPTKTNTDATSKTNMLDPTSSPTFRPVLAGTPYPQPVDAITTENVNQIEQLSYLGKGQIEEVAYSPDGDSLAVASSIGVFLYDTQTLKPLHFFETEFWVDSVAFSPDGQFIAATLERENTVRLWSIDGTFIRTIQQAMNSVVFSPDGQTLAAASSNSNVGLWSIDGTPLQTFSGHTSSVASIAFSPDGSFVASASWDDTIRLWSTDGGLIRVLKGHTDDITSVRISPDGQMLASASKDETVRLWSIDGTPLDILEGHRSLVTDVAFSPDGSFVASASADQTVRLWLTDGTLVQSFEQSAGWVISVTFHPHEQQLVSATAKEARQWSISGTLVNHTANEYLSYINSVAFSPDGQMLASGSEDKTARLWDTRGTQRHILSGAGGKALSVVFSPDGSLIGYGSSDRKIRLWSPDGKLIEVLEGHQSWVTSLAFSPDSQIVASGSLDKTVRLWSTDGTLLETLSGHTDNIWSVDISPDGKLLASGAWDKTIRLWSIDGRPLGVLEGHQDWVNDVTFNPDGQILASGSNDRTVRLWTPSGQLLNTLDANTSVTSVAFSPDGQILALASSDRKLYLWSIDGRLLTTLKGHTFVIKSVAFNPDGKLLASASFDGTVRLWGVLP